MRKRIGILCILALFLCGAAFAQSAKFAAVWSDNPLIAATEAATCTEGNDVFDVVPNTGALLATMKMPSGKEILAGVSAQSLILLDTSVKGKNGGSGTATGFGVVGVRVKAVNVDTGQIYFPVPGKDIVLNARLQSLSATLGGVIESCTVPELGGTIDVEADCVVDYEEIGLLTANASANHFNVVFPNLPSGTYQIRARFLVLAGAGASVTGDACAYAGSFVVLGNRIVTLQDVRAVKGPIEPVEID